MDKVYRVFQKGQDPASGAVVTGLVLKSIITQPIDGETLAPGPVTILGAAYAGENEVKRVEVSVDDGNSWEPAEFIGPQEPYAWRHWQCVRTFKTTGRYRMMSRATDAEGNLQPVNAEWNVLGYFNNGIQEHAVTVMIE